MRALRLALALIASASLPTLALADEPPKVPADVQACLDCHENGDNDAPKVDKAQFLGSVHAANSIGCADCHQGYTAEHAFGTEPPALTPDAAALVKKLTDARWVRKGEDGKDVEVKVSSPRAYLACGDCHDGEAMAYKASIHGAWLRGPTPTAGPTCTSCHGVIHGVQALGKWEPKPGQREQVPADRRVIAANCIACHGNAAFAQQAGLDPETVPTYFDSIHGRLVRLGSNVAPSCMNCHAQPRDQGGSHGILPPTDEASIVHAGNRAQACARCHAGATTTFSALVAHKPIQEMGGQVPHFVHIAFSWLTTLTLLFFVFHVAVDTFYELRVRLARKQGHGGPTDEQIKSAKRFDIHQRVQHIFMLSGVILLGVTGWPLRGAGSGVAAPYSKEILALFGGPHGAAMWHRVGAVLIIISAVYHLAYLTLLASRKVLPLSMLPGPKDAIDMRDNILFMLGLRKERPRFDKYNYLEKFDYWAVFWGIVMMVGTGFIFWFPVWFASWAPGWLITVAQIIHGEEATLAIAFLFVVHFYNVHLKPSNLPHELGVDPRAHLARDDEGGAPAGVRPAEGRREEVESPDAFPAAAVPHRGARPRPFPARPPRRRRRLRRRDAGRGAGAAAARALRRGARRLVQPAGALPPLGHGPGGEAYLVAERAGRVVGYAARRGGEVTAVFVRPAAQGRGVGAALVAALAEAARAEGRRALRVDAARPAIGFYRALGFTVRERLDVPLPGGAVLPAARMVRAARGPSVETWPSTPRR
ncbi:MAG: GNAT family N-acetyltransferase [Anaeromyxobacter sp.]